MHRARGIQVVPRAARVEPAGLHDAVGGEEEPLVSHHLPAGDHRAGLRCQVEPRATQVDPSCDLRSGTVVVAPRTIPVHPTRQHVAVLIEAVHAAIKGEGLVLGVVTAGDLPPPADAVIHPGTHRVIGCGCRIRGRVRRGCRIRGRVRRGCRIRGRVRRGCRFLSQGEGNQTRLGDPGLVHRHDTDNGAVALTVDRQGQLGTVLVFHDGPRVGTFALDLPEQGRRGSSSGLGLDRDLRPLLACHGTECAVSRDLRILRRVSGDRQRLNNRRLLLIGIRGRCGGCEGFDLRERKLTELGGLDNADEACVEALEVDRARAAADSVNLDRVDAVNCTSRRGVKGGIEARRGGDHPEVVQALVARDSLAVVGRRAVPDVHDAERVFLAEVDLPPGVGLLTRVGDRAVIPHAVRIAVNGARSGASPPGRGHGGCLVEGEVVAALGDGEGRACRGRGTVGVRGDGVELCAVILEGGRQRVHGARSVRDCRSLGRSLGDAVPLDGGGRAARGNNGEGSALPRLHRHRCGIRGDHGRLSGRVLSVDVHCRTHGAQANRIGVVGRVRQLEAQRRDLPGLKGEPLADFSGLDLCTGHFNGRGPQSDLVRCRGIEVARELQG